MRKPPCAGCAPWYLASSPPIPSCTRLLSIWAKLWTCAGASLRRCSLTNLYNEVGQQDDVALDCEHS